MAGAILGAALLEGAAGGQLSGGVWGAVGVRCAAGAVAAPAVLKGVWSAGPSLGDASAARAAALRAGALPAGAAAAIVAAGLAIAAWRAGFLAGAVGATEGFIGGAGAALTAAAVVSALPVIEADGLAEGRDALPGAVIAEGALKVLTCAAGAVAAIIAADAAIAVRGAAASVWRAHIWWRVREVAARDALGADERGAFTAGGGGRVLWDALMIVVERESRATLKIGVAAAARAERGGRSGDGEQEEVL